MLFVFDIVQYVAYVYVSNMPIPVLSSIVTEQHNVNLITMLQNQMW